MALKFNMYSFMELDTPDLLINIWSYSDYLNKKNPNCVICGTYRKYCIEIIRRRWVKNPIFFNEVMKNITKNNENFIDLSKYSSMNRQKIITDLKKIQRRRPQEAGVIY